MLRNRASSSPPLDLLPCASEARQRSEATPLAASMMDQVIDSQRTPNFVSGEKALRPASFLPQNGPALCLRCRIQPTLLEPTRAKFTVKLGRRRSCALPPFTSSRTFFGSSLASATRAFFSLIPGCLCRLRPTQRHAVPNFLIIRNTCFYSPFCSLSTKCTKAELFGAWVRAFLRLQSVSLQHDINLSKVPRGLAYQRGQGPSVTKTQSEVSPSTLEL